MLALLLAGCAPEDDGPRTGVATGTPPRAGCFGSLRDMVLMERTEGGRTQPYFVDRFEVTRGDWAQFAATPAGRAVEAGTAYVGGNPALPIAGVDLRQARAFARWRFARLPRQVEWAAAVGTERHPFPWGSREDWTRANAGELGLGEPTMVGTFESGRRTGGDQPYDLIGNVSEWTESVPLSWTARTLDPGASFMDGRRRTLLSPSLAIWQGPGGLVPLALAVAACGDRVPREVVGADFQTSMTVPLGSATVAVESVPAGERRLRTGFRIYTAPGELLHELLTADVVATPADLEQLRRFLRRGAHRAALAVAWHAMDVPAAATSPVQRLLRAELAP